MDVTLLPYVSIIILNYNGKNYIRRCVESVLKSEYYNFELVIIDNNSTDDSFDIVKSEFHDDRIKLIRNSKNLGFASGNNLGVNYAKGEYIVLLNVDTEVDTKWLGELISVMQSDLTIGAAQAKLLSLDDKSLFDSAGDYLDFYGFSFRRGGDWIEKDSGQYDNIQDIFSARGAAVITRKQIVQEIGLFDDDYFLSFEDIDFCWRVKLYGKRVTFVPKSIVYHKGAGISSENAGKVNSMHGTKNIMMTMLKNYNRTHLIKFAIIPHFISLITGLFILEQFIMRRENKFMNIKNRLMAFYWLLSNSSNIRSKRRYVQSMRKTQDSEIMKSMLKTSVLDILVYMYNIGRLGRSKATMLYFTNHVQGSKYSIEK
jgi:GT2 family glycosyltransferase